MLLLHKLLSKSYNVALWDYRARIARQFIRIAALKGKEITLKDLKKLEQPTFAVIVWKNYFPYVSEHILILSD